MDILIQLVCILLSFGYGMFIFIVLSFNKLFKSIIKDLLFVYILSLLYIVIIYKVNNGVFHIYFFIVMIFGYVLMYKNVKFILKRVNSLKNNFFK